MKITVIIGLDMPRWETERDMNVKDVQERLKEGVSLDWEDIVKIWQGEPAEFLKK